MDHLTHTRTTDCSDPLNPLTTTTEIEYTMDAARARSLLAWLAGFAESVESALEEEEEEEEDQAAVDAVLPLLADGALLRTTALAGEEPLLPPPEQASGGASVWRRVGIVSWVYGTIVARASGALTPQSLRPTTNPTGRGRRRRGGTQRRRLPLARTGRCARQPPPRFGRRGPPRIHAPRTPGPAAGGAGAAGGGDRAGGPAEGGEHPTDFEPAGTKRGKKGCLVEGITCW